MAVNSIVLRVSGTMGLDDNSIRTFLGLIDSEAGLISFSDSANTEFRAIYPSKKAEIEALAPYLASVFPTRGQIVPGSDPVDGGLVVNSLSMVITGRVAEDDNNHNDFSFEVRDDGSVYDHTGTLGQTAWIEAFALDATGNSDAETMLSTLYSATGDIIAVSITT